MDGAWPEWWRYPKRCSRGHLWRPGSVSVSWVVCQCAGGDNGGHLRVSCRHDRCPSVWYDPPHQRGAEVTGRPGG